jgi:general secretion pathway protein C
VAGVDTFAKRYFPGVVLGLLGAVAFLQGRGIASLIGQQLPSPAPPIERTSTRSLADLTSDDKNAAVVLSRNAFDSVTGPISTVKKRPETPKHEEPIAQSGEPPECTSGSVVLIAGSDDPSFAFAMIKTSSGKSSSGSTMRRIGDDVDGKKVESIGWDQVVLGTGGDRCRLLMHDIKKADGSSANGPLGPDRDAPMTPSDGPVAANDPSITKLSDTEFVIDKNAAGKLGEMQSAFLKSGRVVPGKGLRLQRAAQTTVLAQLGLKKGDMITTINGYDMTQPDKAMEVYGKLKTSQSVKIVLERDGKPMTIDLTVK